MHIISMFLYVHEIAELIHLSIVDEALKKGIIIETIILFIIILYLQRIFKYKMVFLYLLYFRNYY